MRFILARQSVLTEFHTLIYILKLPKDVFFKYSITFWEIGFFFFYLGKKARTFDFNAMFEQTRRTAVERNRKILGEIHCTKNNCTVLTVHFPVCVYTEFRELGIFLDGYIAKK